MKSYSNEKRKALLKDRGFIYRYPKLSVWTLTIAGTLIFFSKPIYDIFIRDHKEYNLEFQELRRSHKSRFAKD